MTVISIAALAPAWPTGTISPVPASSVPFGIGDFARAMLDACPEAAALICIDANTSLPSIRMQNTLMHQLLDRLGESVLLVPPEPWPTIVDRLSASDARIAFAAGALEYTIARVDGSPGFSQFVIATLRDRSDHIKAVADLERSRQQLALHIQRTPLAVIEWDLDFRVTEWNPAAESIFGYSRAEALGRHCVGLILAETQRTEITQVWNDLLNRRGGERSTNSNIRKDGKHIFCEWHNTPLIDTSQKIIGVASTAQDITHKHEWEVERERMLGDALDRADRDPLTGLLNHRAFHTRLSETAAEFRLSRQPYAVVLMDLDNFKFFNDAYGHNSGDQVLRSVSRIIRGVCRSDDALARLGGDEFGIVLPGAVDANAENFVDRLRTAMQDVGFRPPDYEWEVPLSVSAAYATCPTDGQGKHDVIAIAEERLNAAKSGRSDSAHIVEQLRSDLSGSYESFSMLNALVSAVDNKDRYTRNHSEDVLKYSVQIAKELGLDDRALFNVKLAALLHDVGKIGVPDDILRKPGKLTDEEFAAVKQHPAMGAVMVNAVPGFEAILDAVKYHHERWDGGGYPTGRRGNDIPLLGRLMAVADAYSAMTTDRPYRKAMDDDRALTILRAGAGSQWDPECVEAFIRAQVSDKTPHSCR